jgi:hypothetical protein
MYAGRADTTAALLVLADAGIAIISPNATTVAITGQRGTFAPSRVMAKLRLARSRIVRIMAYPFMSPAESVSPLTLIAK